MPRSRSHSQNRHIAISRIAGVVIYRVDNPLSGCSAGFWTTRVRSCSRTDTAPCSSSKETRIELDFQHAPPGRCRCLGRDTDAPAVRELLDVAMGLVVPQITAAAVVVGGVYHHHLLHNHHHYEAGSTVAAMLVFLKRALRLPALGDAELDLWDDVCWPPPPPSPCGGEYDCCGGPAEVEVGVRVEGEDERSWQQRLLVGSPFSPEKRKTSSKLKKNNKKQKKQQPERLTTTAPPPPPQKTKQPTGDRGRAGSSSGKVSSLSSSSSSPPWWRAWVSAFSSQVGRVDEG
ncbi:hypothetical protein SLS62_009093 [Diatrype stigma]|uniref:Uncharacterized protein n=1 Tax=Diatrype stigma TaxID=117547 RepID=A0AAN9UHM7_9PEZI